MRHGRRGHGWGGPRGRDRGTHPIGCVRPILRIRRWHVNIDIARGAEVSRTRPNAGNARGRPVENSSAHLQARSNQKLDHRGLGLLRVLRSGEGVLVDASFQRAAREGAQTECLESISQALGI